jgi:cell division protein FtsB
VSTATLQVAKSRWRRPEPSGRTVLIAVTCLFLVVVLASPLQTYLNRRSSVSTSVKLQQQLKTQIAQLQQQTALWNDPAYVERQARVRLQYVRPGDTLYTVLGADGSANSASDAQVKAAASAHGPSWNAALWNSVVAAGADKAGADQASTSP